MNAGARASAKPATQVLVVDDDEFQIGLIEEQLRQLGVAEITTAHSGAQALERVAGRVGQFRLILLDLHMPGMDGFELMERLEAAGFSGGLVIVTGQSDDVRQGATLVAQLRKFRLLGSIPKPVERTALSAMLAKLS